MLKRILILLIVSDDTVRKSFCVEEVHCVVLLLRGGIVITRKL